jgi:AcrR family transcriptional regulator
MSSHQMEHAPRDRRVQRTRQALLDAFFKLILQRPYDDITVGDIVARAGVGRSTLYEHFAGKNAILAVSLGGPFAVLAQSLRQPDNTAALTRLLEHFWENRRLARGIFSGPTRAHAVSVLVALIEQQLRADAGRRAVLLIPTRLAAIQLAEALFGPLAAWLTSDCACTAARLARGLRQGALALRQTLCGIAPGRAAEPARPQVS